MAGLISTAAREYANRPKDESFESLDAMISHARHERSLSREVGYNLKDLQITADRETDMVRVTSPKGTARFTHWSFGQFARMIGAPAGYLRSLPATIAADAMNYGIKDSAVGTTASLLVRAPNGTPEPVVRAVTTDSYARLWDDELYQGVDRTVLSGNSSGTGSAWIAPPTWAGDTAGTWRGDRDSFVIRVDGGSIVTDPSIGGGGGGQSDGRMYRGMLIRNSEVGASAVVIDWVLFEYICGNLNLWGAVIDKRFRRRHVGTKVLRETMRELGRLAREWSQRSASQDEAIIRNLMNSELAATREAVIDELHAIGYTKAAAEAAIATCEKEFKASPYSYWGIAQGTTKNSQSADYQDERYTLDQLASKLMAIGARVKVAA